MFWVGGGKSVFFLVKIYFWHIGMLCLIVAKIYFWHIGMKWLIKAKIYFGRALPSHPARGDQAAMPIRALDSSQSS